MHDRLIAVVDDDPDVSYVISEHLAKEGVRVEGFVDAISLFGFLDKEIPDLILLDIMLPAMDGLEICKRLKETERFSHISIIMLSGKDEEIYKVSSLNMGADDYIVKPFSLNELSARVKAVLRREEPGGEEGKICIGKIMVIDLRGHEVTVKGKIAGLTPAEFKILELLASEKNQVFSRDRILEHLWGKEKIVTEKTIDVHIRYLREKLGKAGTFIKSVRGIGYKLEE